MSKLDIVSRATYHVTEIRKSEFPEENNVVALEAMCLIPTIHTSFDGQPYQEPSDKEKSEIIEALEKAMNLGGGDFTDDSESKSITIYVPAMKSTGTLYVKYDGYKQNLLGIIRVTSLGVTDSGGMNVELKSQVEKFRDGEWSSI